MNNTMKNEIEKFWKAWAPKLFEEDRKTFMEDLTFLIAMAQQSSIEEFSEKLKAELPGIVFPGKAGGR